MKRFMTLLMVLGLSAGLPLTVRAETTRYGITYYPGNVPIVISVPHGGTADNSTEYPTHLRYFGFYYYYGNSFMEADPGTRELALKIRSEFAKRFTVYNRETGAFERAIPYIVVNNWSRTFLDVNRDPGWKNREWRLYDDDPVITYDQDTVISPLDCIAMIWTGSANCWTALACRKAWHQYFDFIDTARESLSGGRQILYIDLHSQTHYDTSAVHFFELGYGIPAAAFTATPITVSKDDTSLRRLDSNGFSMDALVRGPHSFGAILESVADRFNASAIRAVPGPGEGFFPSTGGACNDVNYYAGGWGLFYNTIVDRRAHHSGSPDYLYFPADRQPVLGHEKTWGLQIETPNCEIDSDVKRDTVAGILTETIGTYVNTFHPGTLAGK